MVLFIFFEAEALNTVGDPFCHIVLAALFLAQTCTQPRKHLPIIAQHGDCSIYAHTHDDPDLMAHTIVKKNHRHRLKSEDSCTA